MSPGSSVLVTGSSSGIGAETARLLAASGNRVVLHARNTSRAEEASRAVPEAAAVIIGDLSSIAETRHLAEQANEEGPYRAVVHNAGVYRPDAPERPITSDRLELTFQVNVLAPYLLTALIDMPDRLVYLSSRMSAGGEVVTDDLQRERRPWSGGGAYSDSKLCDIALAMVMARRHPEIASNAVCPGWVRTRMGGPGAPTDLATGAATQVWLAESDNPCAVETGRFMRHMNVLETPRQAADERVQESLIAVCEELSGVSLG